MVQDRKRKKRKQSQYFKKAGMNAESLYSEDYVEMWKMIEESFGTLCNIWDEIGIHGQEARDKMKNEYVRSFKDVLQVHINSIVSKVESVFFLLFDK